MTTHQPTTPIRTFDRAYINGQFVTSHGTQVVDLVNQTDNKVIGKVTLADEIGTRKAIGAAKEAFNTFSQSSKEYRMDCLQRLHEAVAKRMDQLVEATVVEYGAPQDRAKGSNNLAANIFLHFKKVLEDFDLEKTVGTSKVEILKDLLEVQENVRCEVIGALRAVLRCAVFHDRSLNELIHSLGHGLVQPLQAVHPVFLATLRKGVEGLFRSTDGFSGVDFVCQGDLADNLVVGRVHQIDDLGSMGSDELAIDVGAIKGSYWSRGFMCFHLCHLSRS